MPFFSSAAVRSLHAAWILAATATPSMIFVSGLIITEVFAKSGRRENEVSSPR